MYCLRCRSHVHCHDAKRQKDRRGRDRMVGHCPKCEMKMYQYVKQRSGSKVRRSVAKKRSYKKRSRSKTRKGHQDFVTHKGDRVYDISGHYVKKRKSPYKKRSKRSKSRH